MLAREINNKDKTIDNLYGRAYKVLNPKDVIGTYKLDMSDIDEAPDYNGLSDLSGKVRIQITYSGGEEEALCYRKLRHGNRFIIKEYLRETIDEKNWDLQTAKAGEEYEITIFTLLCLLTENLSYCENLELINHCTVKEREEKPPFFLNLIKEYKMALFKYDLLYRGESSFWEADAIAYYLMRKRQYLPQAPTILIAMGLKEGFGSFNISTEPCILCQDGGGYDGFGILGVDTGISSEVVSTDRKIINNCAFLYLTPYNDDVTSKVYCMLTDSLGINFEKIENDENFDFYTANLNVIHRYKKGNGFYPGSKRKKIGKSILDIRYLDKVLGTRKNDYF